MYTVHHMITCRHLGVLYIVFIHGIWSYINCNVFFRWWLMPALFVLTVQRWRSLRVEIEHESHSPSQRPSCLAAARHLQVCLWHKRWIFPIGHSDVFSQTRILDLCWVPGLTMIDLLYHNLNYLYDRAPSPSLHFFLRGSTCLTRALVD